MSKFKSIIVSEKLHKQLKVASARAGITVNEMTEKVINAGLGVLK